MFLHGQFDQTFVKERVGIDFVQKERIDDRVIAVFAHIGKDIADFESQVG